MKSWDPQFLDRSPMLGPLAQRAAALGTSAHWPSREALQSLVSAAGISNACGIPLRLIEPASDAPYELGMHERGELQVREKNWHDFFNVLAWLTYPRTKAALNARHVEAAAAEGRDLKSHAVSARANRGRVRDALTVFDESGALFVCEQPALVEDLRAFRWKDLFWSGRDQVRASARVYVIGHGLLEKALNPYVGMTAHALPIVVSAGFVAETPARQLELVDALTAELVADASRFSTPQCLTPLPLLGVPGWWEANEDEAFYCNTRYFRPARR